MTCLGPNILFQQPPDVNDPALCATVAHGTEALGAGRVAGRTEKVLALSVSRSQTSKYAVMQNVTMTRTGNVNTMSLNSSLLPCN